MIELDLLEMPMPMDGLSKRARDGILFVLKTSKPTYKDILRYGRRDWLTCRNFGVRSLREIADRLAQAGFELPEWRSSQ